MAWDQTRPVQWQRLIREWVVYAGIMTAIFLLLFRDANTIGAIAGVLVSGPLYLAFGYALAKLGYQRKTFKQLRAERPNPTDGDRPTNKSGAAANSTMAAKPPPTRRTSQGPNRPPKRKRR